MSDFDVLEGTSTRGARARRKRAVTVKKTKAKKKPKTKKRKRVSGATKGFGFERKLAVKFGLWWTEGDRDDVFWRTEGSGSRATSRAKRGKKTRFQYGDMTFTDPIGMPLIEAFNFEFKNYRTYDLLSAFAQTDPNKSWLVMWAEARIDALLSRREPILITKKNQHDMIMWMPRELFIDLYSCNFRPYPRVLVELKAQSVRMKKGNSIEIPQHAVYGVLLDDFFETMDPRVVEELLYGTNRATRTEDSRVPAAPSAAAERDDAEAASSSSGGSSSNS
jgi:hypothetical protein